MSDDELNGRIVIDDGGWIVPTHARHRRSRNCEPRPAGTCIDLLVLHCISLPEGEFGNGYVEKFFTNQLSPQDEEKIGGDLCDQNGEKLKVSAHVLIGRDGALVQFVSFADQARHAGVSFYQGKDYCNVYSIGIELEGVVGGPFTDRQYDGLTRLSRALLERYPGITPERIVGHSDVAMPPGRKDDPGPGFDWERYRSSLVLSFRSPASRTSPTSPPTPVA